MDFTWSQAVVPNLHVPPEPEASTWSRTFLRFLCFTSSGWDGSATWTCSDHEVQSWGPSTCRRMWCVATSCPPAGNLISEQTSSPVCLLWVWRFFCTFSFIYCWAQQVQTSAPSSDAYERRRLTTVYWSISDITIHITVI